MAGRSKQRSSSTTWDLANLYAQQPQNLPVIFKTLSGEVATDAKQGALEMTSQFLELMLDPTVNGRTNNSGDVAIGYADENQDQQPSDVATAYGSVLKDPKPVSFDQRWSAWGSAFGGGINANGDTTVGSTNVSAQTFGGGGGMDYHLTPNLVAGFALAGGGTSWNVAQGLGTGRSTAFLAGLYATAHFGPAYLASAVSFANHWFTTDRFAFAGDHLSAAYDAQSYGARVEGGYRLAMPIVAVTPYAAAELQHFATPSYSETDLSGGGFGLAYDAATANEVRAELGARFDKLFVMGDGTLLTLRARGAWAHDWVNDPGMLATFEAALQPGTLAGAGAGFTVNGAAVPNNLALASVGAELQFANHWSLLAKINGELASEAQVYTGSGTLRYSW